ncbi:MAG TPA: aminotransferase, partial [Chitinophagaceae bacterium]|nr:aminotransferase [Chitinophagaceae bacterium]
MPADNRRRFLKKAGTFSAITFFSALTKPAWARNLEAALRDAEGVAAADLANEEDFWYCIQQSFTVS